MLTILPVISFVCFILLSVFLPVSRVHSDLVNLSLVLWLVVGNLVHGINAIVWSDNTDIHIPVWCDLVTKIMLGANVALPGACACISVQLEYLSSKRPIVDNPYTKIKRLFFQLMFCLLLPGLYISFHVIAQDHRFNILRDFGPFASIHPSTPALILIWIPPLLICSISFMSSVFAISHAFSYSAYNFRDHLSSRCGMTTSLFFRRIVTAVTLTSVLTVVNLFALFSPPDIVPWDSWDSVHQYSQQIKILTEDNDISTAKLMWWGIPIASIAYIFLSFTVGEEVRDSIKWFAKTFVHLRNKKWDWKPNLERRLNMSSLLPIHKKHNSATEMTSRSPSQPRLTLDLRSGWDDMLSDKSSKASWSKRSKGSSPTPTPSRSISPADSPPSPSTPIGEDEAFIESTLEYLDSPAAQSLGLHSLSPSPVLVTPPSPIYATPTPNKVFIEKPSTVEILLPRQPIPEDASSTISSIMEAPWPLPPSSLPSSRRSHHSSISSTRSITPPPFQDTGIAVTTDAVKPLKLKIKTGGTSSNRTHARWPSTSRRNFSHRTPHVIGGEVVYMTVVQEVA